MKWVGPVALILSAIALLTMRDCYQQALGARDERIRALGAQLDSLATVGRRLDTVYLRDTLRLTQYVDRWHRLTDTMRLTDTLHRRDTVTVTREVLVVADSTIRACTAALGTCEQRVGNLSQRLALTERQRDEWRAKASPSLFRQLTDRLPWIAGAYLLGKLDIP